MSETQTENFETSCIPLLTPSCRLGFATADSRHLSAKALQAEKGPGERMRGQTLPSASATIQMTFVTLMKPAYSYSQSVGGEWMPVSSGREKDKHLIVNPNKGIRTMRENARQPTTLFPC